MKSKTKVTLSQADIQELVGHAFGNIPLLSAQELTAGWFNTAYHLTLGRGYGEMVLKVGPSGEADILSYEKDILRAEVETMKLVATDSAIPMPRITFDDFSRRYLPYDYYFMQFIEGLTWDKIGATLSTEQNNAIAYQLGQITARINTFEQPAFGYYAYDQKFDTWPDAFRWMCELLFADAERYDIALDLSAPAFFAKFDEHQAIFAEITHPQLVHWDLWAGNIFISFAGDSPQIASLVDFERTLWGDPLMEAHLARLTGLTAYMAGYGADLLARPAQRLRRIFYNIYLHLIMIIEDGPRQYDDKGSVIWARERLREDVVMLENGWHTE